MIRYAAGTKGEAGERPPDKYLAPIAARKDVTVM